MTTTNNLPSGSGAGLSVGQFVLIVVLCGLLLIAGIWAGDVWTSANTTPMSIHGWIALGLGLFFSLVIGCGLMTLMFYSSRSGHDEVATPKLRKEED